MSPASFTNTPSDCTWRIATTKRSTCAAARNISITRWCCVRRRVPAAAASASRSAASRISTRPRRSFRKTASLTRLPISRSRVAPCNLPIRSAFRSSSMPRWRSGRISCAATIYKGCHPQRLDHFNVFAAEVQDTVDFYARLGFRLTEYAEEDGPQGRIAAAWLQRKGNVHDFAITNGKGPRLHHFAYWVPGSMNILHLCDVMASSGYLKNIERGPGRHGISNAFFLYVSDL